jgi:putative ABC transport system permease protein
MTGQTQVSVAGLAGPTDVIAYSGDSSWGSYQMIAGSWFNSPGQAVVPSGFLTSTGTHLGDTITLTDNGHRAPVRLVGEVFSLRQVILTDTRSLDGLGAYVLPESIQYDIDLKTRTDVNAYLNSLNRSLDVYGITAQPNTGSLSSTVLSMDALATTLTLMLVGVAGLGVLNTVILDTRERIRDFGIYKALGMSPRQTIGMVVSSVAVIGLISGLAGVPIGIVLHDFVLPRMGAAAGTTIPHADLAVYRLWVLLSLIVGGWVMATAGALLPAGWATKIRTATALRTE